jgi:biopolymer transport protein ExbD
MALAPAKTPQLSEDDVARMNHRKLRARKKRKEREMAEEIKELNITAMMDMMTIILVFLLKSFASSSASMTASDDVRMPMSSARLTPKDTVAITITPKNILVGAKKVLQLQADGTIPADAFQAGKIAPLDAALSKEVEKLKYIAERNPNAPFSGELSVIGDKKVPYDLLLKVLYTAGQNELSNYRFVVISKDG